MAFEQGKCYRFKVDALSVASSGDRYYQLSFPGLKEQFRVKMYDFQADWSSVPETIDCVVVGEDINRYPRLVQRRASLLGQVYSTFPVDAVMTIRAKGNDYNSGAPYLLLMDASGLSHRYYYRADNPYVDSYQVGELFSVRVRGIREKINYSAFLDIEDGRIAITGNVDRDDILDDREAQGEERVLCEREDLHNEWKSSLAYPAGETEANIERQIAVVTRVIAGFMNAEGGSLYLGVKDDGSICGIEDDYPHLLDLSDAEYKPNEDHYELAIRNSIKRRLGGYANTLVSLEFKTTRIKPRKYCIVSVKQAEVPIFYSGEKLFLRVGNMVQLLKDEAIIRFVLQRCATGYDAMYYQSVDDEDEQLGRDAKDDEEARAYHPLFPQISNPLFKEVSEGEAVLRWLAFYPNGSAKFYFRKQTPDGLVAQIPITEFYYKQNYDLFMCYDNGCVNRLSVGELRARLIGTTERETVNGWNIKARLVNVFCLPSDTSAHIALYTEALTDGWRVKLLSLSNVTRHGAGNMALAGNQMVALNTCVALGYPVLEDILPQVEELVVRSIQTSGKSLNSKKEFHQVGLRILKDYIEEQSLES